MLKNCEMGIINKLKKGSSDRTWTAISFLLRASTNVNAKDKYGFTVLHHAVYRDNTLVVKTLLKEKHLKLEVLINL